MLPSESYYIIESATARVDLNPPNLIKTQNLGNSIRFSINTFPASIKQEAVKGSC